MLRSPKDWWRVWAAALWWQGWLLEVLLPESVGETLWWARVWGLSLLRGLRCLV